MEESTIKILYDNKDAKCKNPECGHLWVHIFILKISKMTEFLSCIVLNVDHKVRNANLQDFEILQQLMICLFLYNSKKFTLTYEICQIY